MPKSFTSYAPPMSWGSWTTIESHGGAVSFRISYSAVGDTVVTGKVRYYKKPNALSEEEFKDEVVIRTANVWANVDVCFKGLPLGSTVVGTVE